MEIEVKIKLNEEAMNNVKEISIERGISFDAVVERIVNNQSLRELQLIRDVETTVKNVFKKDNEEYLKIVEDEFKRLRSNLDIDEDRKSVLYSKLMTKMEQEFKISALNNDDFNTENEEVITLYREISYARKF